MNAAFMPLQRHESGIHVVRGLVRAVLKMLKGLLGPARLCSILTLRGSAPRAARKDVCAQEAVLL